MSSLNIKDINGKIIMPDSLGGIDTSNILLEYNHISGPLTYLATEDCIAICKSELAGILIKIDNITVGCRNAGNADSGSSSFLIKKGQTFYSAWSNENLKTIIYGIKY